MLKNIESKPLLLKLLFSFLFITLIFNLYIPSIKAADGTLSALSDGQSRLKKSTNSTHTITFTTSVAVNQNGDTITVTFPADYNFTSIVIGEVTFSHNSVTETLAAAPSATEWGAVFSGTQNRILTLTAPTDGVGTGSLDASQSVSISYASTHSINATTAGSYTISIAIAGTNTATGKIGVVVVDEDQVSVTGSVDPILTFSISDTAVGFGTFVGTAIRYATADTTGSATEPANDNPVVLTAATNGIGGWTITVRDEGSGAAAGLYSSALAELIPASASTAVSAGSKTFGVYGKNADVGVTINECFDHDSVGVCTITGTTTDAPIHHSDARIFASTTAPSNDLALDLTLIAAVNALTKAGQYSDTITVICTANY